MYLITGEAGADDKQGINFAWHKDCRTFSIDHYFYLSLCNMQSQGVNTVLLECVYICSAAAEVGKFCGGTNTQLV